MKSVLNVSEAFSLALHAVALLAGGEGTPATARSLASSLGASEAHLSKVLQRLTRAGITRSARGPGGGFVLARPAARISLLDVYKGVEGPLHPDRCLLATKACAGKGCIFSDFLDRVNREFRDYLANTRVSEIENIMGSDGHA